MYTKFWVGKHERNKQLGNSRPRWRITLKWILRYSTGGFELD